MTHAESDRVLHGAVGGVLAGIVVVAWFFIMDLIAGDPFGTPARLSSAVLREEFTRPWPRLIVLYSVLHFGVFVVMGVTTNWALRTLELQPGFVVAAIFGVFVLNAVHYAGLLVTGTNLLTVVPVRQVTIANVLGGVVMMAYLRRTHGLLAADLESDAERPPVLAPGLMTGLVGAATVAMWFLAVDLVAGSPLRTPTVLGSALVLGAASPEEVRLNGGVIIGYSVLHLATFAVLGIAFVWLTRRVRGTPDLAIRALGALLFLEVLFFGTVAMASDWVVAELGWLSVLIANVLAIACMGGWIRRRESFPAP
jgi:hypothetical protein